VTVGLDRDHVHRLLETWTDLLYREYYASKELYLTRGEAVLEHFESEGWIEKDQDQWVASLAGHRPLAMLAEQTRGVVECYETIVRVVLTWMESAESGLLRSRLIEESQRSFESAQLLGEARRTEALSDTTLDNALSWLISREILVSETIRTGKRNARDTRYARGEKWTDLEGISALLAAALRAG
jgi:glycerol-3-phosphate O-acyltransferase